MTFTKKHYEATANIINKHGRTELDKLELTADFIRLFRDDKNSFDLDRFLYRVFGDRADYARKLLKKEGVI